MLEFKLGRGIFTVRPAATLLTLIMFAVLCGLGAWQVQRLHWKENLIQTIEARIHNAPVPVTEISINDDANYRPATATGLLQHDHEFYLNSISGTGVGGYHILTPMQLENGAYILIDRGWVPYDRKKPETRLNGQLFGPVDITGILRIPQHAWGQPANNADMNDWYWVDLQAMAARAGIPALVPFVLEADAAQNPGGFPIGGQTRVTLPNNHLGYVFTWFGLAISLLVIYGISGFRKVS